MLLRNLILSLENISGLSFTQLRFKCLLLLDSVTDMKGMLNVNSVCILEPYCHIEGIMRWIIFRFTKRDVAEGPDLKCTDCHKVKIISLS